jgi:hypothetical protein
MARLDKELDSIAKANAVDLLESMIVAGKAGDVQAARWVLDRIWRSASASLALRPTRTVADLQDAMHDVLAQMSKGKVSVETGEAFISVMRNIAAVHQLDTLPFSGAPIEITDARQSLAERVAKAIAAREERQTININAETPATSAGGAANEL